MFWGTTNRSDYLRDETGSCRFFPVEITRVNIDTIVQYRDQLIGEAFVRLEEARAAGEDWWRLSDEAQAIVKTLRESRTDDPAWTSIVLNFVDGGRRYVPFETDFHAEGGGESVLRAVLEPVPLPSDLRVVQDAMLASLAGLGAGSPEAQARQQQCAEQTGLPLEVRTAKAGIRMRLIPHGSFSRQNPAATNMLER